MRIFSMFSGVGGFDLACQQLGHEIVGACEIDEYARQTYQRHFPNVNIYHDATKMQTDTLPQFDVLCAGFPCQPFSIAGQRLGFEDTRGSLFFEIARVAKAKRPRYLLLENVKGLLNHDKGQTFRVIISSLDELGYDAEWQVLNSKDFGVPQNRERVFIVGHLRGASTRQVFPFGQNDEQYSGTQKEERAEGERIRSEYSNTIDATYYKMHQGSGTYINELQQVGNIDQQGHNSIWGRVYDPKGISSTLNAHGGGLGAKTGLYKMQEKIRKLTPMECERLQGFPDNWTKGVSDTQRYRQMGNAVTVPVIKAIVERFI